MAGTRNTAVTETETVAFDEKGLTAMQSLMSTVGQEMHDERDLVNQLLGQAQMADAVSKFTGTVAVSKMAYVKENKLYRGLAGMCDRDGPGLNGTWEEFCRLLGVSPSKANEDINNLHAFGEEALKSMSRIGIGYRELRQYRRLPEDEKAALIEIAKTGDKESFVDLAEEIISRHTTEKEELNKKLANTQADYEAQAELLANKDAALQTATLALTKAKRRLQTQSVDEASQELRIEVTGVAAAAEAEIVVNLRFGFEQLLGLETPADPRPFMAGQLRQLEIAIARLRDEFDLENDGGLEMPPEWLTDANAGATVED